jgi:hypothetical protein
LGIGSTGCSGNCDQGRRCDCGSEESLAEVDEVIDWVAVAFDMLRCIVCFSLGWLAHTSKWWPL